jgi:hypothetical protein
MQRGVSGGSRHFLFFPALFPFCISPLSPIFSSFRLSSFHICFPSSLGCNIAATTLDDQSTNARQTTRQPNDQTKQVRPNSCALANRYPCHVALYFFCISSAPRSPFSSVTMPSCPCSVPLTKYIYIGHVAVMLIRSFDPNPIARRSRIQSTDNNRTAIDFVVHRLSSPSSLYLASLPSFLALL